MSIQISDSTSAVLVGYYNDKGVANVETVSIPATGEYGQHILSVPATAAAGQGDFCVLYSKAINKSVGVWLDIDANGTPPTSIVYSGTDYQVEVNIVTGGTAIQNAALLVLALAAETNFTDVTVLDNTDGTITFTQDVVGSTAGEFGYANSGNTGAGSFLVTIVEAGLAGITQADYVVLTNSAGATLAVWFDVDEDGTEPTGAAYGGADDVLMIPIVTGSDANTNVTATVALLDAEAWADLFAIVNNFTGTFTLTTPVGLVIPAADPRNADDSALGAITSVVDTAGTLTKLVRQDSFPKGSFNLIADRKNNILVFNSSAALDMGMKGKASTAFKYSDITLPTSTSLFNLKSQIDVWNETSGGGAVNVITNEDAKTAEMTGLNGVFTTTYPFVYHSIEVFFNQLKMTLNVDYTEDGAAGEITFLVITPNATLPTPDTLTFNYIKL